MVGERITAIPRNLKADISDFKTGIKPGLKGTYRRFMGENKYAFYRAKSMLQRGVSKVKGAVRKVTKK